MTLTPEGEVLLRGRASFGVTEEDAAPGKLVRVEALFLDRFAVTNAEYQRFVEAGGYEQMSLWSPEIWPGVLNFVDQTGQPGPRFWKYGGCRAGQERHPVVGVSWYEASAYARWVGKRLATDAEWVKAGAWPVPSAGAPPIQRKFPWGETMERRRANLWGSGAQGTVPVDDYEPGASISGVYQLVGNVWEWTSSNFGAWDPPAKRLELATPMKSIRGGAFDTYFDGQATCQFQSGESPVERRHNIGFRCAVGVCDLALRSPQDRDDDFEAAGLELETVA
jgi:iron(II)-dependent oxidoreductase